MEFLGKRVQLNPRPARQSEAALEVAMLGHCPGQVRIERLLALQNAVQEIRESGFGPRLDKRILQNENLYHLPIPLHAFAEFMDIFPEAAQVGCRYQSHLAGDKAWLVQAVKDFFTNGGEKLWVVQLPEAEAISGFLPDFNAPLYDMENLRGLSSVLVLNRVGLISMPDLERLQIPANLPDIPRKRLANPEPRFIPCSETIGDDHRERRLSEELIAPQSTQNLVQLMQKLLGFLHRHRPDIQCLFSMPLAYSEALQSPAIDEIATAELDEVRLHREGYLLRQMQFIFPYLKSPGYPLVTAVGALSGVIASSARQRGIWRSVADMPIRLEGQIFPSLDTRQKVLLREKPGLGVFCRRRNQIVLDDERLCVPALHRDDYLAHSTTQSLQDMRSAEVARFMGFLMRELQRLGERLIFAVDYRDPRPKLILQKFFLSLFQRGALRGSLPENAFTIRQSSVQEAVIAFDIEIAPAFPIDRIQLTFVNRQGNWFAEVANG